MFDFLDGPIRELMVALYGAIGYVGVALIVALESVVVPIPSEVVLPFAGFLTADPAAFEPLTGARWSPLLVVVAGVAGSVLGSLVAYAIGAVGGRPFLLRFGRYLLISPADVERADAFFARHGTKAAFFGRMVPVVRSLVSFMAGISRMPLGPYVLYSTLGSLPWVLLLVGAGTVLGASWPAIEDALRPLERIVLVGLGLAAIGFVAWRLRHRWVGLLPSSGRWAGLADRLTARRTAAPIAVEVDPEA